MKVIDPADKVIQSVIFEKPEVVVKILRDSGVLYLTDPLLMKLQKKHLLNLR